MFPNGFMWRQIEIERWVVCVITHTTTDQLLHGQWALQGGRSYGCHKNEAIDEHVFQKYLDKKAAF